MKFLKMKVKIRNTPVMAKSYTFVPTHYHDTYNERTLWHVRNVNLINPFVSYVLTEYWYMDIVKGEKMWILDTETGGHRLTKL